MIYHCPTFPGLAGCLPASEKQCTGGPLMMILIRTFLSKSCLVLAVVLVSVICCLAQIRMESDAVSDSGLGGANTIEGHVTVGGRPISRRIRVKLSTPTRGDLTSMTDDNGRFLFRGLPSGDYVVVIDAEKEFKPVNYPVNIIQLRGSPGQNSMVSIRLEPKPGSDAAPGVLNSELAGAPPHVRELFNKAGELAKAGDHQGAIDSLKLAVAEYPNFMTGFFQMGIEYYHLNQLDKADESFQAALKIQPDAFGPLKTRGIVLILLNRYPEAEAVLKNAVKANSQSAEAHFYLGRAIGSQGRFDDSEKEFLEAIKLGKDEMKEAHRMLAIIYSQRGDKKRAAGELETYLKLNPTTPDAEQLRKVIEQMKNGG